MNLNKNDIIAWASTFNAAFEKPKNVTVILAPSAPYLGEIAQNVKNVEVAAQDVSIYEKGAHTGDFGAFQIKDFCKYAIVGHSERAESLDLKNKKVEQCIAGKITPIICIASVAEFELYRDVPALLAWEDPNNISVQGQYRDAPIDAVKNTVREIRKVIGDKKPLIYGGSVNRQNVHDLANIDGLDGGLVGNASNDPLHFIELIKAFNL